MSGRSLSLAGVILVIAGCSSVKTEVKVQESADLVEQRTGQKPEWTAPWDVAPPTWSDQTVLRLDDVVAAALRNNRELRGDVETIGQANADLLQATLFSNPVINFMIMFPDGGGRSMLRGNGLPIQPLQDLWLIPVRTEVSRRELQQAVLRVADRAVATAAEVKRVYARLQYTQRAIELIRENIEVVNQSTEIIRIRQAAGQSTQVEVTLSHIRAMRLQSDLVAMESEHRTSQRELLMLIGLPSAEDNWRVESVREAVFRLSSDRQATSAPAVAGRESEYPIDSPSDERALLEIAAEQRLDLKAAEWMAQAAEKRIQLRRREGWPELSLGLGFERSPAPPSNNQTWAGRAGNYGAQALVDRAYGMTGGAPMVAPFAPKMREVKYTIGPMLDMEIPIFDWGQAQTARAIHEWQQRVAEYEALAQQIIRNVRQNRITLRQAYDQILLYRETILPEVERNLQVARQSFVAGRESVTVYLGVQEDLITTRLRVLEFLRDYLVTQAELERQVGGRLASVTAATQPAVR